jgi:hypothetical protein
MADTVSFYFFSRGVKRSVHRPVKKGKERITLENGSKRAQRLNPSIDSGQAIGTGYCIGECGIALLLERRFQLEKAASKLLNRAHFALFFS